VTQTPFTRAMICCQIIGNPIEIGYLFGVTMFSVFQCFILHALISYTGEEMKFTPLAKLLGWRFSHDPSADSRLRYVDTRSTPSVMRNYGCQQTQRQRGPEVYLNIHLAL